MMVDAAPRLPKRPIKNVRRSIGVPLVCSGAPCQIVPTRAGAQAIFHTGSGRWTRIEDSWLKVREAHATVHLALDQLEAGDLALGLAVAILQNIQENRKT